MTQTTLRKVTLSTIALLACLALSAQAGRPNVSSARQKSGSSNQSINPIHKLLFPDSTYMFDDGTAEDSVGFGNGAQNFESLWFNQFDVIPGQTAITAVEVAWGTPLFPDPSLNGQPVTVAVWSDPNGDGNPSDAVLLGSVAGTIQNAGTDTFVTYTFSPAINLPAGATSFFVGDKTQMNNGPEQFPQGLDENSTLHRQSWIAAMSSGAPVDLNNPGNNDFIGLIDDFGLPGNWLIRADATTGGPFSFAFAVSRKTHGGAGKFDVALPGIDPRKGAATLVFTFTDSVASVDSVSTDCGSVTNTKVSGATYSVALDSSSCGNQNVTVTLTGVHSTGGETVASASATVGLLLGDVNGDGTVDSADIDSIKMHVREPVTSSNFRNDVQPNGTINMLDARTVRTNNGGGL